MKVFIIVALAFFATVGADEEPTATKDHPEGFHHYHHELAEKLKGMSDEERTQEIEKAVDEQIVKFDEMHKKFMVASPQERKEMEDTLIAHMPREFRENLAAMTEEDRDAVIVKKFDDYGAMNTEERKTLITKMINEALKKMEHKSGDFKNHHEGFHHYHHELAEKLKGMSDEERTQEIAKAVDEHLEKFDEMHRKFMAASPEERKEMEATIMAHMPPKFRGMLAVMIEKERDAMIVKKFEEYGAMNTEERKALITEMINEALKKMEHKVEFKDLPEDKRLHMKEKFESLSPEERQKLHDKLYRKRFQVPNERPQLTEEQMAEIREIFEKLTPEQVDEIKRQMHTRPIGPRQPLIPTPAVGDGETVIQEIRRPEDDILLGDLWTDDEPRVPRL